MIEQRLEKVKSEDEPQCQATVKTGQCPFRALPGSEYCKMHQGGTKFACARDQQLRNYRLAKWQSRLNEFADNSNIKSLREEIGILRIILEETINKCQDTEELIIYSGKIADNVIKIEKLVSSCHRLELSLGVLLDKTVVLQIADTIIETIGKYITDSNILDKIGNEIIVAIMSVNKALTKESSE